MLQPNSCSGTKIDYICKVNVIVLWIMTALLFTWRSISDFLKKLLGFRREVVMGKKHKGAE